MNETSLMAEALGAFDEERWEDCEAALNVLLSNSPEHAEGNLLMARLAWLAQCPVEARTLARTALQSNAEDEDARELLAKAVAFLGHEHLRAQQYAAAISAFEELVTLRPEDPDAWAYPNTCV